MSTFNKIKALIFLLLALLLFIFPAKAQFTDDPTKSPQERAEILTGWMVENLDLTDAQKSNIKAINTNAATAMENAKKEFTNNFDGFLERGKEIEKDHNIKLRTALNPMQWSKYQKFRDGTSLRKRKDKNDEPEVAVE